VSVSVSVCLACGRAVFPRRLLCPDCGGTQWRSESVDAGVLEATTERDGVGAVRAPLGPLLIARLERNPRPDAEITLDGDGAVPVARPRS
jgi:uncharacterized protein